ARVAFELADGNGGRRGEYVRVEEGRYGEDGKWEFLRVWNGDQVDWGLNFGSTAQVLRVRMGTY
ncbi:MAG TPA: DUF5597 domain-containing protein, partial [Steroidobacteraceae bacterium]|nr:DUF5597 domain-containing protein [Steroidobacteraceae bacterium]